MAFETFTALIPAIPAMIESGKSVWANIIKPILKNIGYNISEDQDKQMQALEEKKDTKQFIEKLQNIERDLNQVAINQTYNGDNGSMIGQINGGVHTTINNISNTDEIKKTIKSLKQ